MARLRRTVASAALAGGVALLVLANVPATRTNQELGRFSLEQGWDVFAPDPVSAHVELVGVVRFADGTERVWHPPRANAAFAPVAYHWDMWSRTVLLGPSAMADAAARWVADQYGTDPAPVEVTLRRRWFTLGPPGSTSARRWHESDFYVVELRP